MGLGPDYIPSAAFGHDVVLLNVRLCCLQATVVSLGIFVTFDATVSFCIMKEMSAMAMVTLLGIVTTLVRSVLKDRSNGRTTITVCVPSSAEQQEPINPRG